MRWVVDCAPGTTKGAEAPSAERVRPVDLERLDIEGRAIVASNSERHELKLRAVIDELRVERVDHVH